jgi:hypothetical protein
MFETKVITAGPGSIEGELMHVMDSDPTWEIKGAVSTYIGGNIRVFLQRERIVRSVDPNQMNLALTPICVCKEPSGVIGSNKCRVCDKVIDKLAPKVGQ